MSIVSYTADRQHPPHSWLLKTHCPHGDSSAQVWLGGSADDEALGAEAYQNHQRLIPECDCSVSEVSPAI
jgi:hypothetical protein